jgi:O-antigen/teichoic acid export membrane protein
MSDSPAPTSLKQKLLRAGVWTFLGYGGAQIIRLGSSLIVTRLLMPEAYGLMALVWSYTTGLAMFTDLGLSQYIFQSKRADDKAFRDSVWSLSIVRGFIVGVAAMLFAYPMAKFYPEPGLLPILLVASLTQFISGLSPTRITMARRDLQQKTLTIFNLLVQFINLILTIALALLWHSVWALVISGAVSDVIRIVCGQLFFPGPHDHWRWDKAILKELRGFSFWIYISSILGFLGGQSDRLMLGKLIPMQFLGLYGIAGNYASIPLVIIQLGSSLLPSALVQLHHASAPDMDSKMHKARDPLLAAGSFLTALVCISSPAFFTILYDPRYSQSGIISAALSLNTWFMILQGSAAGYILAFGDARGELLIGLAKMLGTLAGALGGYLLWGFWGFVFGLSIGTIICHLTMIYLLRRHGIHLGPSDIRYTVVFLALAGIGWGVNMILRWVFPGLSMTIASLAGCIPSALLSILFYREYAQRILRKIAEKSRRRG